MLGTKVRTLALSAALVLVGISCYSDMGPTGVAAPDVPTTSKQLNLPGLLTPVLNPVLKPVTKLVGTLVQCAPQPYAADTMVVGSAGGTMVIGRHRFVIPAGALDHPVRIIAEAPSDKVVSVRFQPEGLQFNPKHLPELTLDYSRCSIVGVILPKRIAYTDDNLNILSYLLSWDNLLSNRVTGEVPHFSRYAIAW